MIRITFLWPTILLCAGTLSAQQFARHDSLGIGSKVRVVDRADLDGDGDIDLVGIQQNGRAIVVLHNDGGGRFARSVVSELRSVPWEQTADLHIADMDGDGVLDLIDLREDGGRVHLGDGTGQFVEAPSAGALPIGARAVSSGDIDGDGDADLVIGGWDVPLQLYTNNGGMSFSVSAMTSTSLFCYSTRMLDFDDDGDLDILSTSRHEFGIDSMTVFENDGAGVFSVAPPLPAGAANVHVTSTQAGDFDLDGDIDLVASYTGGFPLFLRNLGGLQFELVPGTMPFGLAFDLDGDGDLDFVRRTDQVFENLGNNVFVARSTGLVGDDDQAINAVVDVDGDGDLDLVGGQNGWNRPRIFANDGDANFVPMQELRVPSTPSVVKSLFDVDGDGDLDVVRTETSLAWELDVLVNDGRGFFTSRSGNANPLTSPLLPICMAHGDVDGDGYQDLFVGDFGQDTLTLNDGSGVFVAASASWLPPEPLHRTWLARLADLDGDGDLDLIKVTSDDVTRDVDDTLRVYLNDSARFVPHSVERVQSPASPTLDLAIADFDADGDLDVALVDQSRIRLMVNDGAGGLSPSRRSAFGPGAAGGVAIQQGDLDGDGDVDLVQPDVPVVWFNDGAGRFRPTRLSVVGPMTAASFVVDVDLDGDLDLLLETPSRRDSFEQRVSQNVLLLNDGAGNFSRAASTRLPLAAQWADGRLIGDLDGDLDVDVLVDGPLAGVLVNLHHDLWVPHRVADGGGLDLEFFAQPGYQSQPTSVVPLLSIGAMPQPVTLGTLGRFWLEPVSLIALNPIPLVDGAARMSLPLSVDSSLIGSKITTQGLFLNTEATLSNLWTETVIH